DSQNHRHIDGFIEFCGGRVDHEFDPVLHQITGITVDFFYSCGKAFSCFHHRPPYLISKPMLFDVPTTCETALSSSMQFKSGILSFAISVTCAMVTFPTLSFCGIFEPLSSLAVFFNRIDTGGVLVMKVNDRSE